MSLRDIPSVQRVLELLQIELDDWLYTHARACVRMVLDQVRADVLAGGEVPSIEAIMTQVQAHISANSEISLKPVINASGVILQTNLGRAPLSSAALAAIETIAAGYNNLEYDLEQGGRGSRAVHVREQLQRLTGAEDALVANNAAAALVLTLSALAQGREVLVSRGQAVEIGGGFRIPDVIKQSGCTVIEVGTTNRTYAHDYAAALSEQSAALLRVHSSNFQVVGFVHEPSLEELVAVAHKQAVLMIDDLGSGALLDVTQWGLRREPLIQESIAAGVDVVICSGDKLLGGPQAGIIVGKRSVLQTLARHPLMRALRVDKLTLAALGATLQAYERNCATNEIPVWQMISMPLEKLAERAHLLHNALNHPKICVETIESTVGGGSLPGATLPSYGLTLNVKHPDAFLVQLRQAAPPVIARISSDRIVLDMRTILPFQEPDLLQILSSLCLSEEE